MTRRKQPTCGPTGATFSLAKARPSVDTASYELAATFLGDYVLLPDDSGTARIEDEWELAGEIQSTIEQWLENAVDANRIRERR